MPDSENESEYLTTKEAAKLLHYSAQNLALQIRLGKIKAVKFGKTRKYLIPKSEIKVYTSKAAQAPTETPQPKPAAPQAAPQSTTIKVAAAKPTPNGKPPVADDDFFGLFK